MTSAATFTALHPPAQEDSMDMSSPGLYDDIEIDFDEQPGGVDLHLTDADRMTDDGEHPRPGTATDLMMEDDLQAPESHVPEQDMQDEFDPVQYEAQNGDGDDDLIDYDDELYDEATLVEDQPANIATEQPETHEEQPVDVDAEAELEQADEEVPPHLEDFATQQTPVILEETVLEEKTAPEATNPNEQAAASFAVPSDDHAATSAESAAAPDATISVSAVADEQKESMNQAHDHVLEESAGLAAGESAHDANVPASLNTSLSFTTEAPGTPTDTGLHPMTICYNDNTLPLFKSRHSPDGLLKNDNLVNLSIAELLNNCRQRISIKLHEDVPEDMDLILAFDGLNLSVAENDHQCSVITLNEVLNVYTQLHANEGVQDVPPFSMTLYTQSKFSSTFNILKQGADAGHGISAYIDNTANEPEEQDQDFTGDFQDQGEDDSALNYDVGAQEQYINNEQSYLDQSTAEGQEYDYQDQEDTTAYENNALNEGDHYDHGHKDADPEVVAAASAGPDVLTHIHEENPAEPEHDGNAQGLDAEDQAVVTHDHVHNDPANPSGVASAQPVQAETADHSHELPGEDEEDGGNVESGASSTTLRAEQAEDAVEPGFDGHDDYSTFIHELDDGEAAPEQSGSHDTTEETLETSNAHEGEPTTEDAGKALDINGDAAAVNASDGQHADDDGHNSQPEGETVGFDGDATDYFDPQQDDVLDGEHNFEDNQEDFHTGQDFLDGTEPEELDLGGADAETAKAIDAHQATADHDPEDSIDFDDDTEEQHEARKASAAGVTTGPPTSKRSFDATESLYDDDEPELKKARSS